MKRSSEAKAKDSAYQAQPEQKKKRAARNLARAQMMRAGKVKKGDGKDVAHKAPLENGINTDASNLAVQSQAKNRGWRKGKSGYNP